MIGRTGRKFRLIVLRFLKMPYDRSFRFRGNSVESRRVVESLPRARMIGEHRDSKDSYPLTRSYPPFSTPAGCSRMDAEARVSPQRRRQRDRE